MVGVVDVDVSGGGVVVEKWFVGGGGGSVIANAKILGEKIREWDVVVHYKWDLVVHCM